MGINSYILIIVLCGLVIVSYLYNVLAKKTNIPSVIMLIGTGILITQTLSYFDHPAQNTDWFPILEFLGIVGLVMIVLEAALDLELSKEKWPIIWKSFTVALLALTVTSAAFTFLIQYFFVAEFNSALIYAIPLSITSSAIVIPSVVNLDEENKEFLIYESTFSDILGIMSFYFVLQGFNAPEGQNVAGGIFLNIGLTLVVAVVLSYVLTYVFQKITTSTKLFLLISVLMMLYALGKLMHISSLLIILFFGLLINNHKLFFRGFMKKHISDEKIVDTLHYFKVITLETSFVVRTFFFVVFGESIAIASLVNLEVLILALIFLGVLFIIRYLFFRFIANSFMLPSLFVSPRGLITIMLFFSIPSEYAISYFDNGILLYMILISSGIMTLALMTRDKQESLPGILKTTSRFMHATQAEKEGQMTDIEEEIIADELERTSEKTEKKSK